MREQYPEEMTVVLQHQFWDLVVSDMHFEVALSFNGVSEKLYVPLDAIKGFFDPSVQFGLQFETLAEGSVEAAPAQAPVLVAEEQKAAKPRKKPVAVESVTPASTPAPAKPTVVKDAPPVAAADKKEADTDKPSGGAEVVRLDRFRKK